MPTCEPYLYEIPSTTTQLLDSPDELLVIIARFALSSEECIRWFRSIQGNCKQLIRLNRRLRRITEELHELKDWKATIQWFQGTRLYRSFGHFVEMDSNIHFSNSYLRIHSNPALYNLCLNAVTGLAKILSKKHPLELSFQCYDLYSMEDFVNDLNRDLDALMIREPNVKLSLVSLKFCIYFTPETMDQIPVNLYQLYKRLASMTGPGFELTVVIRCLNCQVKRVIAQMSNCFYCDRKNGRLYCCKCSHHKDLDLNNLYPIYANNASCSECFQGLTLIA